VVCSCRYLNNIVEQDHRAIKRRCAPMLALKSFRTAAITLAGIDLAHRIRKRQFSFGRGGAGRFCSLRHLWAPALVRPDFASERNTKLSKVPLRPPRRQLLTVRFAFA
jgi:hypothetical protein